MAKSGTLKLPGVNFQAVIFGVFIFLLVVGLFFIPEIIGLFKGSKSTAPSVKFKQARPLSEAPQSESRASLGQVESFIKDGYFDSLRIKKVVEKGDAKNNVPPSINLSNVTWDAITSKQSKKFLISAQKESIEIAKALPLDRVGSRYALMTFSNGVEEIAGAKVKKLISPSEAVKYLEYLRRGTTEQLINENVDRELFERWAKVNFGPVISKVSASLGQVLVPFNPQLTLTNVAVKKDRLEKLTSRGYLPEVKVSGYVVGGDISSIEIWGKNGPIAKIKTSKPNARGIATFQSGVFDGSAPVTFRVTDNKGNRYEKVYSFFPRSKVFPVRNNRFLVPKATTLADTRIDRFFTLSTSGPGYESTSFFGGPLIGRF